MILDGYMQNQLLPRLHNIVHLVPWARTLVEEWLQYSPYLYHFGMQTISLWYSSEEDLILFIINPSSYEELVFQSVYDNLESVMKTLSAFSYLYSRLGSIASYYAILLHIVLYTLKVHKVTSEYHHPRSIHFLLVSCMFKMASSPNCLVFNWIKPHPFLASLNWQMLSLGNVVELYRLKG